jgi:hypothetical protein
MKLALCIVFSTLLATAKAALPVCPDASRADFDYVVVGAGAGGGPLAARLAESGFSGILDLSSSAPLIRKALGCSACS